MKKFKAAILNLITFGGYKRRKRPSRFENYIKDLRELTLNYQTKELQKEHINPLNKFGKKIINIHPSLLPKYKGLNTHSRAIKNKDKLAGCTVHYVAAKLDSGKIILQKKVKISAKDNPASLKKKVLKQEHKLYPAAIMKIFN